MGGIKRNLCYWGKLMEQQVFTGLLMLAILSLAWAVEDIREIPHQVLRMYAGCLPVLGIYLGCLSGTNNDRFFSFTISMGSTRRDTFIGMEVMLHVLGLELLLFALLANGILPTEEKKGFTVLILAGICCSFLAGVFGNTVTMIRSRLQGALGGTLTVLVYFGSMGAFFAVLGFQQEWTLSFFTKESVLVISILLDAITGIMCYLTVKKAEVRL